MNSTKIVDEELIELKNVGEPWIFGKKNSESRIKNTGNDSAPLNVNDDKKASVDNRNG